MVNFKTLRESMNPTAQESTGIIDEMKEDLNCGCGSMSYTARVKGFIACFLIGIGFTIVAYVMVFLQNYTLFGVFYSFGTLTALASSFFLVGPQKQVKNMFAEKRWIASSVALLMIALTLCAALWWKKGILVIMFSIFQFLAMTWYAISYIPFARNAVKSCATSCL